MPFEEQIERWDRTATACPGSFARELRDYWIKKHVMPENTKRLADCNCDVCATAKAAAQILKNGDFDTFTNEVPKGWSVACDHGVPMVNECEQCNAADANNRICKSGDGIKEQLATKQNPFYKDEK